MADSESAKISRIVTPFETSYLMRARNVLELRWYRVYNYVLRCFKDVFILLEQSMKKLYKLMPEVYFDDFCLRTIKKSDAKDMYEYGKDKEVTRYLNWGPFILPSEAKKSIMTIFYPRLKEGLPKGYAIIDTRTSKMIGTIDFHSKIKGVNGAEIGFVIHKDYWNKGIMTKALDRIVQIGFDYLGYDLIKIKHLKENIASQKVILKVGFKYIRSEKYILEKKDYVLKDDLLIYELSREDYHVN